MNKQFTDALNHAFKDKSTGLKPWAEFIITGLIYGFVAFTFGHLIALWVL